MTRRESETPKPTRKRVRDNHNELERVRRNTQKAQLDALRVVLPFQDMDDKASMVSIFVRAREYIGMLEHRIMELQGSGVPVHGMEYPEGVVFQIPSPSVSPSPSVPSRTSRLPSILNPQNETPSAFTGRGQESSNNADYVQVHNGIPFYNSGFSSTSSLDVNSYLASPIGSAGQRSSSPSPLNSDTHLNADHLFSYISDNFLKMGNSQRLSSDEERDFMKTFCKRRASSLLMPLEGETVMVQKRESFSTLFSGLLPDFIDANALNSTTEINCNKCKRGMCNMIMIDCDRCHKWYHIKCAHIDSDAIPTVWRCC